MKKVFLSLLPALVLLACTNNDSATVKSATDSSGKAATTETVSLPYAVQKTPDWEPGNQANVAVAMNTLKAYVDNNLSGIGQYLADSVEFLVDNIRLKTSRDSLAAFFSEHRKQTEKIDIRMQDYESVKSKSRGEEWVGLWYVETGHKKDGTADSAMVMDDIRIINGKVAVIDSKSRRLQK